jgi:CheY-like chemotaxis protein
MTKDRTITILLVEDNEDDVVLIQRALRKGGIDAPVHVACDGDEAIAYLSGTGKYHDSVHYPLPTVVLLDIRLPRKNGLEVLEWLKSHDELALLPVVMFTNSAEEVDIRQAYKLGANSYLKKPYTLAETTTLLQTIGAYWLDYNRCPPGLQRKS